jgi:hypothetical protein
MVEKSLAMMRSSKRTEVVRFVERLCLICLLGGSLLGCRTQDSGQLAIVKCRVSIDGQTAQDVRVVLRLQTPDDSDAVLEGITDHLGIAHLQLVDRAELPTTEVIVFRAAVESLGDWHIIKPWSDLQSSPLDVSWSVGEEQIEIDLPKKCVRAL